MGLKVNNDVVILANNAAGSLNGRNFKISGIIESVGGPSGKYGYINIEDAKALLRMNEAQVSEVAIRLKNIDTLDKTTQILKHKLGKITNKKGKPVFEVHPWTKLSPFYNIARMIDLMVLFIKAILITIVLISVMNVMVMAVYERVKEIGTMSAMGTPASKIRLLFIFEGLLLGIIGVLSGSIIGSGLIYLVKLLKVTVKFGRMDNLLLRPYVNMSEILTVSLIVIVVSAIAVIDPAIKAAKLEPADALRE